MNIATRLGFTVFSMTGWLFAQAPPPGPKASAPIDLTGYWVSLVTEDWRYRMLTAPKGDYYRHSSERCGAESCRHVGSR